MICFGFFFYFFWDLIDRNMKIIKKITKTFSKQKKSYQLQFIVINIIVKC